MTTEEFWQWVEAQMQEHGFRSFRAVEKAGGVGNGTISGRARYRQPPTDTTVVALSRALNLPLEVVESYAYGKKLPRKRDSVKESNLLHWFSQLSDADQEHAIIILRTLYEARQREKNNTTPNHAPRPAQA